MNKAAPLILILLLTVASTIFLNTEKAWGAGTIYIRPDGQVDPPYPQTPIYQAGDIYTFTDSISDNIVVQRDNIIVNGDGYALQGSGSGAGFDLSDRHNVTLKNLYITQFTYGICLNKSVDNTISHNTVTRNTQQGISLWNSSSNTISANDVSRNGGDGICICFSSSHNTIAENIVYNNSRVGTNYGIFVSNSSSNILSENKVFINVHDGTYLWHANHTQIYGNNVSRNGADGISIGLSSFHNTIANNTASGNSYAGISLGWEPSSGNIITGNNITYNIGPGIYVDHSNNNKFYHNNLLFNTEQVFSASGTTNIWDDGYPSGGNCYSNSLKGDNYWGPYQNKTGSDGVIDAPYAIYDNKDGYPLMSPYYYWSNPLLGDINKDTTVDKTDLSQLAVAYGSTPEKLNWNPNSDINSDNMISVSDLFRIGENYGKTSP